MQNDTFRNLLLKNFKIFGSDLATSLDRISYLIKSSKFLARNHRKCETRDAMYADVLASQQLSGAKLNYLEFGVWEGESIKWWAANNTNPQSSFAGFDSFEGLPEKWDNKRPQGLFSTGGLIPPTDDRRISFHKGWFKDTLPGFIEKNKELLSGNKVINMDADLYSSTLYVLVHLMPYLKKGDIIIFDDFYTIRYNHTEFRAFLDFTTIYDREFEEISQSYYQIVFRIK